MKPELRYPDGLLLPKGHSSLAEGVVTASPGAINALSLGGGYSVGPRDGRIVYFGRNRPLVHICLGEDDAEVSRRQGELVHHEGRWWLRNLGRRPIRLPRAQYLFVEDDPIPLAVGYTPIHIPGSSDREHLLEIYVTGPEGAKPPARHDIHTIGPRPHDLSPDQQLMLTVLGQQYLRRDLNPKPLTWQDAASQLAELQPDAGWTAKKLERRVATVRDHLSRKSVPNLTREEVGEPVGNALNDNLIRELIRTTAITPKHLDRIEGLFQDRCVWPGVSD